MPARQYLEQVHKRDSCGERGCGPGEVEGDAGDAGEGDPKGEEGEGGALGGEGEESEDDWVSQLAKLVLDVARGRGVRGLKARCFSP